MTVKEQLQELTQKVDKMHAMLELLLNSSGEQSPQPAIPSGTIRWGGYSDTNPVITGTLPSNYSFIGGGITNTISSPGFPERDQ